MKYSASCFFVMLSGPNTTFLIRRPRHLLEFLATIPSFNLSSEVILFQNNLRSLIFSPALTYCDIYATNAKCDWLNSMHNTNVLDDFSFAFTQHCPLAIRQTFFWPIKNMFHFKNQIIYCLGSSRSWSSSSSLVRLWSYQPGAHVIELPNQLPG